MPFHHSLPTCWKYPIRAACRVVHPWTEKSKKPPVPLWKKTHVLKVKQQSLIIHYKLYKYVLIPVYYPFAKLNSIAIQEKIF